MRKGVVSNCFVQGMVLALTLSSNDISMMGDFDEFQVSAVQCRESEMLEMARGKTDEIQPQGL